tara:strand:+ start:1043 stop:1288 length:246 start_codon:yes stop_codon:yes gene_type:complete
MSKSLDRVLQPDGSYKWEVVELTPPSTVAKPEVKEVEKTNDFESMTKKELESFGRTVGIELDKRHTKADLIAELEKFTSPE